MQKSPSLQASWDAGRVSTASLVANPCLRDAAAEFKPEGEKKVTITVPCRLQLQREVLGPALLPPFWRQSWGHCPPAPRGTQGEKRETLGNSNTQGPAQPRGFSICVQYSQIQVGEQRTSLLPPSPSTTVGHLAPQCPGPGWRPPAHGAGRGRGHSFHVINMVTEFAQGQSWE